MKKEADLKVSQAARDSAHKHRVETELRVTFIRSKMELRVIKIFKRALLLLVLMVLLYLAVTFTKWAVITTPEIVSRPESVNTVLLTKITAGRATGSNTKTQL